MDLGEDPDLPVPEEEPMESLDDLASKNSSRLASIALDDPNQLESLELPGADLSGESLDVAIIPVQKDEFQCAECFLIVHVSRASHERPDTCRDCD